MENLTETQKLTLELLQAKSLAFDKINALESQLNQADSTIKALLDKAGVASVRDLLSFIGDRVDQTPTKTDEAEKA